MAPKFGTSGLRGLVVELTDPLIADYLRAFLASCPIGTGLWIGQDLRPSSPRIARAVAEAALDMGLQVTDAGAIPTPALALAAMADGAAAVMVTGSHIPADRNGLKFYLPRGEITKQDEARILQHLGAAPGGLSGRLRQDRGAGPLWTARYHQAYGPTALAGMRIGLWSHSAVSRDLLREAFAGLGARIVELDRSDQFIPIDTEAVSEADRARFAEWFAADALDCILSTDGDGDRPLLVAPGPRVIPGDILGQITAASLGAAHVVTPVSSNSGAELSGRFARVLRTRIGSPFVIAGMEELGGEVVGYEANGGFLLGYAARAPRGLLAPLATRDSLLPLVATLVAARAGGGLNALLAAQPARFTAADRLQEIAPETTAAFVARLEQGQALQALLARVDQQPVAIDRTDGLRVTLASGAIWHMRPSGNAPEFRLYVEADSQEAAERLLQRGLALLAGELGGQAG